MELKILGPLIFTCLMALSLLTKAQVNDTLCDRHGCCCGNNDPRPAGVMISHVHPKNEWMASYRYMIMGMQGISEGMTDRNQNDVLSRYTASPDWMQMNMHMLMVMYGVSNKFTAMVMFNYTASYMQMTMPVGKSFHHHGVGSSGVGDTRLYGLYALTKKATEQLLISTGLNIPSGSINSKGETGSIMYPGQRLPYQMQLGSGSYDLLPGLTYLHRRNKMTYSSQLTSIIRGNYNSIGYKFGNELNLNAWAAWQWLSFISSTLRLEANSTGKIKGKDQTLDRFEELSANPSNYGGKRLNGYIGSSIQFKNGILKRNRISFEYGLPIYQDLNGIQMKAKSSLYAAWTITF